MASKTSIEWAEATWNPITGCTMVSAGCTNCYAMRLAGGRLKNHSSRSGLTTETPNGPVWNGAVRFNENWLDQPTIWRTPKMIFVVAHGDLFHEQRARQMDRPRVRDHGAGAAAHLPDSDQAAGADGTVPQIAGSSIAVRYRTTGGSVPARRIRRAANERIPHLLDTYEQSADHLVERRAAPRTHHSSGKMAA